jgi:hypothetical protein
MQALTPAPTMPIAIMPAITTGVASDVAAFVIINPRPALAPMYSAATTAIQPIAAAARAALASIGAAARKCTCHARRQGPMPSIVPTRDSVGSTWITARAVETTITKNTAYATSRILPV